MDRDFQGETLTESDDTYKSQSSVSSGFESDEEVISPSRANLKNLKDVRKLFRLKVNKRKLKKKVQKLIEF